MAVNGSLGSENRGLAFAGRSEVKPDAVKSRQGAISPALEGISAHTVEKLHCGNMQPNPPARFTRSGSTARRSRLRRKDLWGAEICKSPAANRVSSYDPRIGSLSGIRLPV